MYSGDKAQTHIRSILLFSITVCFALLLLSFLVGGPNALFDEITIVLSFGYFTMLAASLFLFTRKAQSVIFLFVLLSIVYYGQRLFFLYVFPDFGRYSRFVTNSVSDMNFALLFLLINTLAIISGFKVGETVVIRSGYRSATNDGAWFLNQRNRVIFYYVGISIYLVNFVLVSVLFPEHEGHQVVGMTDSVIAKILMHFIVYNAIFTYGAMLILLHPQIKLAKKEKYLVFILFLSVNVDVLVRGNKDVLLGLIMVYIFCKLTLGQFRFDLKRFAAMFAVGLFVFVVMFPLHQIARGAWKDAGERVSFADQLDEAHSWYLNAYKDVDFSVMENALDPVYLGFFFDFMSVSQRLGGIDYLTVLMSEKGKDIGEYVGLTSFLKEGANRLLPLPEKPFPDAMTIAAPIPVAIRGLTPEQAKYFTEPPSLFGLGFLIFWWGAFIPVFIYGAGIVLAMNLMPDLLAKIMFMTYFLYDAFITGDVIEDAKAMLMYFVIIWVLKNIVFTGNTHRATSQGAGVLQQNVLLNANTR